MLAVQTSRRVGQLERALDWVILWLKALGDNITAHMAEPVSLWVKTKIDAARTSEEDLRLRYIQILMLKGFFLLLSFETINLEMSRYLSGKENEQLLSPSRPGTGPYVTALGRMSQMRT